MRQNVRVSHALSCSITALLIHWILALRARRSVTSFADDVDVVSARKQSASPCSRALCDWCTEEMRWGCSPRSVGGDMEGLRKRRQEREFRIRRARTATLPRVRYTMDLHLYSML